MRGRGAVVRRAVCFIALFAGCLGTGWIGDAHQQPVNPAPSAPAARVPATPDAAAEARRRRTRSAEERARAGAGRDEEDNVGVMAEVVAQDLEGPRRVAEVASDLGRGALFDEVGAQGLVLALLRGGWCEEEAAGVAYRIWLSDRHMSMLLHQPMVSSASRTTTDGWLVDQTCRDRGSGDSAKAR